MSGFSVNGRTFMVMAGRSAPRALPVRARRERESFAAPMMIDDRWSNVRRKEIE
jgi:hypothetical protein